MADDKVWEPDPDDPAWQAGWEYIRAVLNSTPVELIFVKLAFWAGVRWQRDRGESCVRVVGDLADVVNVAMPSQIPVPTDAPRFDAPRPPVDPFRFSNEG